jgi:hypothetical protein
VDRGDYTVEGTALTQNGATTPAGGTGATFSTPLYAPLTWTYSEAGDYTVTSTSLTQNGATAPAGGTGATFNTASFGLKTVTVSDPGSYTVEATNPVVQGSSTGSGTGGTFTVTWVSASTAGDLLLQSGESIILNAAGFDNVSAIQVSSGGVLQISPIEN